jgi:hypothetical protein
MEEVPIPYDERVGRSKLSVIHDGRIFLQSILWTAMGYNPVRILGLSGMLSILVTLLVVVGLIVARLSGIRELGPWGVAALFGALVMGVSGISIFALGATFNYLVSLFYKQKIRQGLFGKPIFEPSLDHHFGWIGILVLIAGVAAGTVSLALGVRGWEISRLWLYLLGSAMMILLGFQLFMYWLLMRVLEQLSLREIMVAADMGSSVEAAATSLVE